MSNLPILPMNYEELEAAVLELADRALLPEEIVFSFLRQSFNFMENGEMPSAAPAPATATDGFSASDATAESTLAYLRANIEEFKTKCPANGWRVSVIGKQLLGLETHNNGWGIGHGRRKWIEDARDALIAEGLLVGYYVYKGQKYKDTTSLFASGFSNNPKARWCVFPA